MPLYLNRTTSSERAEVASFLENKFIFPTIIGTASTTRERLQLAMSFADIEQPPAKKRRFFVENSSGLGSPSFQPDQANEQADTPLTDHTVETTVDDPKLSSSQTEPESPTRNDVLDYTGTRGFDAGLLENFVGEKLQKQVLERLREIAGDNIEQAVNVYLDGSWKAQQTEILLPSREVRSRTPKEINFIQHDLQAVGKPPKAQSPAIPLHESMPTQRYVGAFGAAAWATRSGRNLLKHEEKVAVERPKMKPQMKIGRGGKPVQVGTRQRGDCIVRFLNARGEEVGRLPEDTAAWVAPLIDQKVCIFEGRCIFAPESLRVNDTIYLQLRCSLLRKAFEEGSFVKPAETNRTTGIFEEKETTEEKSLRLRQIALVKLFNEINLHPSTVNPTTAKHKREGILQAAEIAEQYESKPGTSPPPAAPNGTSTPPTGEEPEDGKELEQDQLDTLYKKAQSFDFNTPTFEPVDTFVMDLRKYQKQALHWMIGKERDEAARKKDQSMHPLWEEYEWPIKDMDEKDLPAVAGQCGFYVNPYSGELSLDFPVQEQHCLGGILADGKPRPSQLSTLADSFRNGARQDH